LNFFKASLLTLIKSLTEKCLKSSLKLSYKLLLIILYLT